MQTIKIEIDSKSGFCFGVSRAIKMAEEMIAEDKIIVSLGDIVHNSEEIARLKEKGMQSASHDMISDLKNKTVLFRAHGEPPSSYNTLNKLNASIVDATCPVVLKLQQRIKDAWKELKQHNGQIVIYGKKGHPEVTGLVGQTNGEAIVVSSIEDLNLIDTSRKVTLFSQTTMSYKGFETIKEEIRTRLDKNVDFKHHNTICAQVGNRAPHLRTFAAKYDVIVFVGGEKSSNAKVLFEVCKEINPSSFFISSTEKIQNQWFSGDISSVGICGATSTPFWLMEEAASVIKEMVNETPLTKTSEKQIKTKNMNPIKKIAVLTSGGDAPGMNAAIRAVVRGAIYNKLSVMGVMRGYQGLIQDDFREMNSKSVSNIIQQGGTILKSARSQDFRDPQGRKTAYENLIKNEIDGLVVIGGDGTFTGARIFGQEYNFPIIGIPGTIDNDLFGTDYTIGYDTALNTVVEAVDKIRDTASAHSRLFFIEVMGRDAGFLALRGGIASGAEAIMIPEVDTDYNKLDAFLRNSYKKEKSSSIVLVAEGEKMGGAIKIAERVSLEHPDYDVRVTILGHVQRGGSPSAFDRVIASRMGVAAVEALLEDQKSVMIGLVNNETVYVPFNKALKNKKPLNARSLELIDILSI